MAENIYIAIWWSIRLFTLAIILKALLSWIPQTHGSRLVQLLDRICDPYLNFFRRIFPPFNGIDFSPVIGIIVLQLIAKFLF